MGWWNWKSKKRKKTYLDKNGYLRYSESNQLVHRSVAKRKLKRNLRSGEVVHHIDRNKVNNSPGNLYVFKNQTEHHKTHIRDAKKFGFLASFKGWKRKK